jgi:hypothetical protein
MARISDLHESEEPMTANSTGDRNQTIIISHSKTKRRIDGPFEICGNEHALRNLCSCILRRLDNGDPFYDGWIEIVERPPVLTNMPPIGWDE